MYCLINITNQDVGTVPTPGHIMVELFPPLSHDTVLSNSFHMRACKHKSMCLIFETKWQLVNSHEIQIYRYKGIEARPANLGDYPVWWKSQQIPAHKGKLQYIYSTRIVCLHIKKNEIAMWNTVNQWSSIVMPWIFDGKVFILAILLCSQTHNHVRPFYYSKLSMCCSTIHDCSITVSQPLLCKEC